MITHNLTLPYSDYSPIIVLTRILVPLTRDFLDVNILSSHRVRLLVTLLRTCDICKFVEILLKLCDFDIFLLRNA